MVGIFLIRGTFLGTRTLFLIFLNYSFVIELWAMAYLKVDDDDCLTLLPVDMLTLDGGA